MFSAVRRSISSAFSSATAQLVGDRAQELVAPAPRGHAEHAEHAQCSRLRRSAGRPARVCRPRARGPRRDARSRSRRGAPLPPRQRGRASAGSAAASSSRPRGAVEDRAGSSRRQQSRMPSVTDAGPAARGRSPPPCLDKPRERLERVDAAARLLVQAGVVDRPGDERCGVLEERQRVLVELARRRRCEARSCRSRARARRARAPRTSTGSAPPRAPGSTSSAGPPARCRG